MAGSRQKIILAVAAAAVALPLVATTASLASRRAGRVRVYFTDGQDIYAYPRDVSSPTLDAALTELLQGPTPLERSRDVRSWIPGGTKLRSARVSGGVAYVDLSRDFVRGTKIDPLRARLVEVVFTATQFPSARGMRLLIDGKQAVSMGQGLSVDRLLTRADVDRPQKSLLPPVTPVKDTTGKGGSKIVALQQKLVELGYLPRGSVTGRYGPETTNAVLAFQGWEGLKRDGVAGAQTFARVARATRPRPLAGTGKRAEVYLGRQVLLLVQGSQAIRAIHISSGAAATATPPGSFKIYRKAVRDWSYPFKTWLPYASYFNGGIAFHEYPDVPPYPASHGCVRVPRDDAPTVYRFAAVGTPVRVVSG